MRRSNFVSLGHGSTSVPHPPLASSHLDMQPQAITLHRSTPLNVHVEEPLVATSPMGR